MRKQIASKDKESEGITIEFIGKLNKWQVITSKGTYSFETVNEMFKFLGWDKFNTLYEKS